MTGPPGARSIGGPCCRRGVPLEHRIQSDDDWWVYFWEETNGKPPRELAGEQPPDALQEGTPRSGLRTRRRSLGFLSFLARRLAYQCVRDETNALRRPALRQ